MTSNGEIGNSLIPCLGDGPSRLSLLRRSNVLPIAEKEMVTNPPIIMLVESGIDFAGASPCLPTDQALEKGVENRQHNPISGVEAFQHVDSFAAFCKPLSQLGMQFDQFSQRITCLLAARHELLIRRKVFVDGFCCRTGGHPASLFLQAIP